MVNLLVWHLLPPVWWGLPWRCSALTVCVCVCMLCVCFSFSPDLSYMCWRVVYMTENVFHVENLCFCNLTFLYFCVCACFFSCVLVGPVQGASGVWAHVRPVVGRPPGRLWQWKDPGVLWPQHGQRVLLFLQVQEGRITPQGVVIGKKKHYVRALTFYFWMGMNIVWQPCSSRSLCLWSSKAELRADLVLQQASVDVIFWDDGSRQRRYSLKSPPERERSSHTCPWLRVFSGIGRCLFLNDLSALSLPCMSDVRCSPTN